MINTNPPAKLQFGSVCSGIEAASVAWHPLGWTTAWLAEIDPFAGAVLARHYPCTPNLGDMTAIAERVLSGRAAAPDVLVGGTPCQAFSVAGERKSLDDERGNLTLRFVELANAIDHVRSGAGQQRAIIVWENVPGVLSTKDNAFGCFLAGLAGSDGPLEPPVGRPADGKSSRYWKWNKARREHTPAWANVGAIYGPQRAIAWRTLDAQYFGLAQRRRRVFVVASARKGFDPAQVLFEWEGMRRDTAPRRAAGESPASSVAASAGHHGYSSPRGDGSDTLIAATLAGGGRARGGYSADDIPLAFGGGHNCAPTEVATALHAHPGGSRLDFLTETFIAGTLQAGGKAAGSATQQDAESGLLLAFSCKDHGADASHLAPTLRAMGHQGSHPNAGGQVAVAFAQNSRDEPREMPYVGALAANPGMKQTSYVRDATLVRRLTPTECERLQGFPDGYTLIEYRGRPAADGPRYKALGNSMATNVMAWIGRRIERQLGEALIGVSE